MKSYLAGATAGLLLLCACSKAPAPPLEGVIEIGDTINDFEEDADVTDASIDSARAEGAREVEEHPTADRDDPVVNSIEESDLRRAREELQAAGEEAKAYGMDKIIYPKSVPLEHPRPDSL